MDALKEYVTEKFSEMTTCISGEIKSAQGKLESQINKLYSLVYSKKLTAEI